MRLFCLCAFARKVRKRRVLPFLEDPTILGSALFWRKVSQHTNRTKMRRGSKRLAASSSQQKRSRSTSRLENVTNSDDGEQRVLRSDTAQSRGSRSKSRSRSQSIHSRELSDHSSDSSTSSDSSEPDNADQQPQASIPQPAQASSVSSNVQIDQ